MILVTLGTQDKSFERLLKAIDKEIENGSIKDEVVVQAGYTYKYFKSNNMKIFDYVETKEMIDLVKQSSLVISHAGAGSILTALENNKKIIVVPRLSKYGEHNNDHQLQIAEEFSKDGYVYYLKDLKDLSKALNEIKSFKPKKLGHNKEILNTIDDFLSNIEIRSTGSIIINYVRLFIFIFLIISLFVFNINIYLSSIIYFILSYLLLTIYKNIKYTKRNSIKLTFIILSIITFIYSKLNILNFIIYELVVFLSILIISKLNKKWKDKKRVLFVSSIGGHLTQLLQLSSIFNDYDYLLITEKSNVTENLKNKYNVKYYIYCNKKNFLKYFIINIINAFHSVYTFFTFMPDVIVTTGANTSVPLCYLCRIFGHKVIFIESYAKRYGKTLAGTLVYPVATTFIVQWESMKKYYPKAKYYGGIY